MGRDINLNILGIPPILLIFSIIAYFIYGNDLSAALAVLLLGILWSIALISALIPFGGVAIYWFIADYIRSWVFSISSLTSTWLTDLLWWLYVILALIITAFSTYFVLFRLPSRRCRVIDGVKICDYK